MSTHTVRRTAAAGIALVALVTGTGCARHLGAQPAPGAVTESQAAAAATAALGTAIDHADAAASTQSSELSASAGSSEGDPTQ